MPVRHSQEFSFGLKLFYPSTREELEEINSALTSSFPRKSQVRKEAPNPVSLVCYSHRRCQSHIPYCVRGLGMLCPP